MYEQFYGLVERPFSVTPNTKFFFPSEKHKEALNSLIYAINDRKGFAVVTGEIGSGKTTIWHALLNEMDNGTKTALITNTRLSPKQIIVAILYDLEIPFKERYSKISLLSLLNKYLLEQTSLGNNVVLVIDEAQNLSAAALEEVRMLSNLETEEEKLIQIILMGQPQLRDTLARADLEQLRQRISVYYHIYPLSQDESIDYIKHRLRISGANGNVIFTEQAMLEVYLNAEGIPRKINTICDRALLTGYVTERVQIGEDIIEDVVKEINEIRLGTKDVPALQKKEKRELTPLKEVLNNG